MSEEQLLEEAFIIKMGICNGCANYVQDEVWCKYYQMPTTVIGGRKKKCKGYFDDWGLIR